MTTTVSPSSNALIILFPGYNTLDVNGPLEVFRKSGQSQHFSVKIASETEHTTSIEGAILKRHIDLADVLEDPSALAKYDLLIVPGGADASVGAQAAKIDGAFMTLIKQFAALDSNITNKDKQHRILL